MSDIIVKANDAPTDLFEFPFTSAKLAAFLPKNKESALWFVALCKFLPQYGITSKNNVAMFLAQCGHESAMFSVLQENLNYSAEGLQKIFGKYFPNATIAAAYARKPEKIANKVYANRMGNGAETTGDGWKFRGKGLIQLTGRDNTRAASKEMFGDERLLNNADVLLSKDGAVQSACWFWESRGIIPLAEKGDVLAVTKKINGGTIGLADREKHYKEALVILA